MLLDLVAISGVAALLPSLGEPAEDPRVVVRPLAEGPFSARAVRGDAERPIAARPSTAAVVDAIRGRGSHRKSPPALSVVMPDGVLP